VGGYEIDRLVSRSVTYGTVLAVLAGGYALAVYLLSSLLPRSGDLAVAASTLGVAARFDRLRRRVQRGVDRRFDCPRYDTGRELGRFVEHLRHEVDLDGLTGGLLAVVGGARCSRRRWTCGCRPYPRPHRPPAPPPSQW
jgi:hypothetical protein